MAFFDWLRRLIGGGRTGPRKHISGPPGICPYCGTPLRTLGSQQCFACGYDWHDPNNVVLRSANPAEAQRQRATVAQTPTAPRPPVTLANLDVGVFAPLSAGDARAEARNLGRPLWSNPWFGRRDLIPPVSDPRTLLIDRAMVGHGLITPEELQEIHRVGELMDQIRPDLAVASRVADAAVTRSKEEREAIKQQKMAEAAERKRRRAEEVARRKQTDIIFLGRGVSRGLADRVADPQRLAQLGLPMLATPADVASALGLSIRQLRWLAFHNDAAARVHYVRFQVPKKSGGMRELAAPHRLLAACQEWILRNILEKLPAHPAAHGFIGGRNTVSNATPHVGRQVVVNVDLKDFFPTVTFPRTLGLFRGMGFSPAAATILALLCTESPRRTVTYAGQLYHVATGPRALPQGACTSPALSNLVARKLDVRLAGIARRLSWKYTRYADDMTFSADGDAAGSAGYVLARIRHIVTEEGFTLNGKKTRVQRRHTKQSVTGVVVNQRCGVPRKLVRQMRAILHRASTEGLAAQNRSGHPHFASWIRGMVAYIHMVNPTQGRPLRDALHSLREGGER